MSFKASDNKMSVKKYTKIWERISNLVEVKFDNGPVYGNNDKYVKTKIQSLGEKVNTNFQAIKVFVE